jgi:hypothetical protein
VPETTAGAEIAHAAPQPKHEQALPEPEALDGAAANMFGSAAMAAAAAGDPNGPANPLWHANGAQRVAATRHVQRTAGNRALQRLVLQRAGFDAGRITLGGAIAVSNATTAALKGSEMKVVGPRAKFDSAATLDLKGEKFADIGAGNQIEVGPTQSVLDSTRTVEYREGGTQAGALVAQDKTTVDKPHRDAVFDEEKGKVKEGVYAPWYEQPVFLQEGKTSETVHFMDEPAFSAPLKSGSGTITGTKGADNFRTSIAARAASDRQLNHLKNWEWTAPWDMQIDVAKGGTGARGGATEVQSVPPVLDGPIALEDYKTWMAFATVEAALAHGTPELLRYLVVAKDADPAAHATIALALKQRNPTFKITVETNKQGNIAFDDNMKVTLAGTGGGGGGSATNELGKLAVGQSGSASVSLLALFPNLLGMTASSHIKVTLVRTGAWDDASKPQEVVLPFAKSDPVKVWIDKGAYNVTWGGPSS